MGVMNTYKVKDIRDAAASKLFGSNLNRVQNPFQTLRQAVTSMLMRIDPPETLRSATLTVDALGAAVAPDDLKTSRIVGIYGANGAYFDYKLQTRGAQRIEDERYTISLQYGGSTYGITLDRYADAGNYTFEYYSDKIFQRPGGTLSDIPDNDNDLILLEEEALNILLWEYVRLLASEIQGSDADAVVEFAETELEGNARRKGLYARYKRSNPSQSKTHVKRYYNLPVRRLGRRRH